jgi:hypothetical protein
MRCRRDGGFDPQASIPRIPPQLERHSLESVAALLALRDV